MSMAISRVSASSVAAVLYPVTKPSRVAKVSDGDRPSAADSTNAAQSTPRPQPVDTYSTADQVKARFEYVRAALDSVGMASGRVAQPGMAMQSQVQQASNAYAQIEEQVGQQVGQALDITA